MLPAPRSDWPRADGERVPYNFVDYYHHSRTLFGLAKDTPESRPMPSADLGRVITIPKLPYDSRNMIAGE